MYKRTYPNCQILINFWLEGELENFNNFTTVLEPSLKIWQLRFMFFPLIMWQLGPIFSKNYHFFFLHLPSGQVFTPKKIKCPVSDI
jgi:hypothetical protein